MIKKIHEIDIVSNIKDIIWRNFIFGDFYRPVSRRHLNVYYWKMGYFKENVGDYYSVPLIDHMKKRIDYSTYQARGRKISAIGSVIERYRAPMVIWGAGCRNFEEPISRYDHTISLVRGPLTAKKMRDYGYEVPELFGDPGLLISKIYQPEIKNSEPIYVPHFGGGSLIGGDHLRVVSTVTNNWRLFAENIANSDLVITSSLHAAVFADSYGVPFSLVGSYENEFKYIDYLESTGRRYRGMASDYASAMRMIIEPISKNKLNEMNDVISKSFPFLSKNFDKSEV